MYAANCIDWYDQRDKVLSLRQHQLGVRRAARARADVPLREAAVQDRHASAGHRLHRPAQGRAALRPGPAHLRREVHARRAETRSWRRVEHKR